MTFSIRALVALRSVKLSSPTIFSCTGGSAGPAADTLIFETACADSDTVSVAGFFAAGTGDAVEGDAGGEDGAGGDAAADTDFSFVSNESGDMAPSCTIFATMPPSPERIHPRKDNACNG
ncbi:hypothetical protein TSA6c_02190 [Azospirillum sp. TSA6c]|nr:hypothetical protein TSA6c_16665 [Azospirillum sp. TSA6c]PWC53723.1 hypothetical protein TSA6c_02190 [Azospirillum sp. TSA6c]